MKNKIWSIYKIQNIINNKIYIGQATNVAKRWSDHKRAYYKNKPTQAIHFAFIKYGLDNFTFEVITSCKTQNDANEIETLLVKQYDSFISNGKGYNATLGGMNARKTEKWKSHMSEIMKPISQLRWSLETKEEKKIRYSKVSKTMKGMNKIPGSGRKRGSLGAISGNRKLTKEQVQLIKDQYKSGISIHKLSKNS